MTTPPHPPHAPLHRCCGQNHHHFFFVSFFQLMLAVEYLHSIGVAHRDLKLESVLLSDDGQRIKVTDFGLAARLDEWEGGTKQKQQRRQQHQRQPAACGTPAYAAPEVIDSTDEQRCAGRRGMGFC